MWTLRAAIPVFLLIACSIGMAFNAWAQKPGAEPMLPQSSMSYLTNVDPASSFNLVHVEGGVMDVDLNIWRSRFSLSPHMSPGTTPESTARAWIDQFGYEFGISSADHLKLVRQQGAHGVQHLRYQQYMGEIPVYNRYVHVNLGLNGLPTMVHSSYAPHLEHQTPISELPAITKAEASSRAGSAVSADPTVVHTAELMVYPDSPPRLIWRVLASPAEGPGSWEVLMDARSGELLHIFDRLFRRHKGHDLRQKYRAGAKSTTGHGLVWDPDPLTMAGRSYGGDFQDNSDLDHDALNSLLQLVELPGITKGADDLYRLEGSYVKIVGSGSLYTPPAVAHPDSFQFTRENDHFESVMSYYHLTSSQLYIQSLDVGRDIREDTIIVRVHGTTGDASYYDPNKNELTFGSGGVDDGEDVEVILHEYGHALLHSSTGIDIGGGDTEGDAYHEGFSDYWAVSHTRHLIETGAVPERDWRQIFDWDAGIQPDGNWTWWPGRYIDPNLTYDDAGCRPNSGVLCDIYYDGLIVANVLMRLWTELGKEKMDRLVLFSHGYLGRPFTMESSVVALVKADSVLNQGENFHLIKQYFADARYPTSVVRDPSVASSLTLETNYPNPFSQSTQIHYTLNNTSPVKIEVFNIIGQRVFLLHDSIQNAGRHTMTLDLSRRPAGAYFLRITAGNQQQSRPLMLIR